MADRAPIYSQTKQAVGEVELPAAIFAAPLRTHLVYETVKMQLANRRAARTIMRGANVLIVFFVLSVVAAVGVRPLIGHSPDLTTPSGASEDGARLRPAVGIGLDPPAQRRCGGRRESGGFPAARADLGDARARGT